MQNLLIAFFTITLLSVAFKDNPFYRFSEHLYVGIYAGYTVVITWFNYGKPTLMKSILAEGKWSYIIPVIIGLMMYARYFKSIAYLSRYTISFLLGVGAGYVLTKDFKALFIAQITATFRPLMVAADAMQTFNNLILVLGVLGTLIYFFFTAERKGAIGYSGQFGKWIMMIAFGSAFGNTVMARVALFLGRLQFLLGDWLHLIK
jgi:hypothetical protein